MNKEAAIVLALTLTLLSACYAKAQPWPYNSSMPPGYGEHRRWHEDERAHERERIERERHRQVWCSHNPYHPRCYR